MQSLLNVPAEVVSANINAAVAKAAAKKRRILRMWELQGPLQDVFSQWDL